MFTRMNGIQIIEKERLRQQQVEGWTPEHDAQHVDESLALAAVCYALPDGCRNIYAGNQGLSNVFHVLWPRSWKFSYWKPSPNNRIKELAKAGALIAAEIDRLNTIIPIGKVQ